MAGILEHLGHIKMVDCARCKRELLGASMQEWYDSLPVTTKVNLPPVMGGRHNDRPYCNSCLDKLEKELRLQQKLKSLRERRRLLG